MSIFPFPISHFPFLPPVRNYFVAGRFFLVPPEAVADSRRSFCASNSDTGEHITDAKGELQYIPFPTCNETNRPLEFYFGVENGWTPLFFHPFFATRSEALIYH